MTTQEVYARFTQLALAVDKLILYKNLRKNHLVHALQKLFWAIADGEGDMTRIHRRYHDFCGQAVDLDWPEHLTSLILEDENAFTKASAAFGPEGLSSAMKTLATQDLAVCRVLGTLSARRVKEAIQELFDGQEVVETKYILPGTPSSWPEWENAWVQPAGEGSIRVDGRDIYERWNDLRWEAGQYLRGSCPAEEMVEFLATYHYKTGYGPLSRYLAFRWQGKAERKGHRLEGIVNPDPVRREQFIGLERELQILAENTEYFLAGHRANNVLLYGNRGTGKSSAVKSLLDSYGEQGLRLVELAKGNLGDLPDVVRHLAGRPQKFILFVDDLSFDDAEPEYKSLKTVLEGGLEAKPTNVLIYATSNRRHLVKENFSERQGDEVHARDTVEEKLSLADRFGITITFPSPDQKAYLQIVQGLADQRGLVVEEDELHRLALCWEMMHNGRSGRTARQFVDYLEAYISEGSGKARLEL